MSDRRISPRAPRVARLESAETVRIQKMLRSTPRMTSIGWDQACAERRCYALTDCQLEARPAIAVPRPVAGTFCRGRRRQGGRGGSAAHAPGSTGAEPRVVAAPQKA